MNFTGTLATSATDAVASADHGTTTPSSASQSFALLSQYLAGHTGRIDAGQIVAALSNGTNWAEGSFLTRPQG
jgi:hypothetical protein